MKLLVAGSLHLDVVLSAPHLPHLDETVAGTAVDYVFGGKGGNQAVAAARMHANVCFAGRAGDDVFGNMIRETLVASRVDVSQLQLDQGASGMSAAIVDANGDYGAVIVSGANMNIEADRVTIPDGTSLVLLQNEIPDAFNVAIAQKAKAAGANVWLNAAPARVLPEALVEVVDFLIVNRIEAEFYEDARLSVDTLITLGAAGVSYQGDHHSGHDVEVVSTHGAGDVFVGALAARVVAGQSIAQAIPFAQATAALHVSLGLEDRSAMSANQVAEWQSSLPRR